MKFTSKKGFTLIELLVVVAIIGILASIVLVSLNSARAKGRDASAKGSMSSLRAAAEIWYDDHNGTYDGFCAGDAVPLLEAAEKETAHTPDCNDNIAPSNGLQFAAGVLLNSTRYFCVDSAGFSGEFNLTGGPITPLGTTSVKCVP